tara:strand:+ start:1250 stop:1435 length:186 start_codon:yes stop_codon:yes gene_type:complete
MIILRKSKTQISRIISQRITEKMQRFTEFFCLNKLNLPFKELKKIVFIKKAPTFHAEAFPS